MNNSNCHPTAIVHETATLGDGVIIGPYVIIEENVRIGDHTRLGAHSIIRKSSQVGSHCVIDSFAVIGGDPQFLGFNRDLISGVIVGDHTEVREGVTIHRSCYEGKFTQVGSHCLLMGNSHMGHDCRIEDHVILANGVLLAGHVQVFSNTFVGGGTAVHQFIRIGSGAMVGGMAAISKDVPPYCMVTDRNVLHGLNLVGLKRRKTSRESIRQLKAAFSYVNSDLSHRKMALKFKEIGADELTREVENYLVFFEEGSRGFSSLKRNRSYKDDSTD
jgi:UDP-N-acetylglucosamine acyltransferase